MEDLRFDAAAHAIYRFVYDGFCDWYIELIKGSFDEETKAVAGWVLDQILVMLHPFMPFVTEELWSKLGTRDAELIVAAWPAPQAEVDAEAKREVEWLIALIGGIRSAKVELGISPSTKSAASARIRKQPISSSSKRGDLPSRANVGIMGQRPGPAGRRCKWARAMPPSCPARRVDRRGGGKGASGQGFGRVRKGAIRSTSACRTRPLSKRPSPRPSTRPAPTTPITAPRPPALPPRLHGWGNAQLSNDHSG
jgi:hypothetical protein